MNTLASRTRAFERTSPGSGAFRPSGLGSAGTATSSNVVTVCTRSRSRTSKSAAVSPVTTWPVASVTTTSTTT